MKKQKKNKGSGIHLQFTKRTIWSRDALHHEKDAYVRWGWGVAKAKVFDLKAKLNSFRALIFEVFSKIVI